MNKSELDNLLGKIGKEIFVQYFHEFDSKVISNEEMIKLLPNEYTPDSRKTRTSKARRIFRECLEEQALSIIAESGRLEGKVTDEARALLTRFRRGTENHKLCEVVQNIPPGAKCRHWILRAEYQSGHHHAKVPFAECPLYLELHWRLTAYEQVQRVGVFSLDLSGLLRERYIRPDPKDSRGPDVRLRIVRANDGSFYVQTNQHGPRLLLPSRAA